MKSCKDCYYWHSFKDLGFGPKDRLVADKGLCHANPPVLVSPIGPVWQRPVVLAASPECDLFREKPRTKD